ncbi:transglutaminase domain protein [Beutenbergia cavernae DSM 12333]|uniref:Transglutaminase domain protein n=1 Tax=Beutenbergia cavernae (strain ATCC BAA-8 / DSM 12333 / CCUG 43141 / JCM 11478 / NBRC 16432 / NCIMB 13614 / HKI 0122) TaxID=471853 RepID=C5C4I0_BEUC1|nr:transglutaminase family protein [Beutenbergia cavernae]ACQ82104.1 transglutaminase domain protein [Beutenbergia cavernae DSM 12333]
MSSRRATAHGASESGRHYRVVHRATYTYPAPAAGSYGRAVLLPRDGGGQVVHSSRLDVDPVPAETAEHRDFHGNRSSYFRIATEHTSLRVRAESVLTVTRRGARIDSLPAVPWTTAAEIARTIGSPGRAGGLGATGRASRDGHGLQGAALLGVAEATLPSAMVDLDETVREFAAPSFGPGRPLVHAVVDLSRRIHERGRASGPELAHLMIASVRSMGLAARYVSGYVWEDDDAAAPPGDAPPGRGGGAHAWASVWVPGGGWLHVDAARDVLIDSRYVVLGWGRDHLDVSPLRGVVYADGAGADVEIEVELVALSNAEVADVRAANPPLRRPVARA